MIYNYIETLLGTRFDKATRALIEQNTRIVRYPAGTVALHEGDSSSSLYMLLQGIVRGYYIDNEGNDITKCFSSEGGMFSSEGLRTEGPSTFTIECLEACECVEIPYQFIYQLTEMNKEVLMHLNKYFLHEVARLEYRSRDLVMKNARERYERFCEEYPGLHERVPLKYIASYIGVRAASLSRIRRQIKQQVN